MYFEEQFTQTECWFIPHEETLIEVDVKVTTTTSEATNETASKTKIETASKTASETCSKTASETASETVSEKASETTSETRIKTASETNSDNPQPSSTTFDFQQNADQEHHSSVLSQLLLATYRRIKQLLSFRWGSRAFRTGLSNTISKVPSQDEQHNHVNKCQESQKQPLIKKSIGTCIKEIQLVNQDKCPASVLFVETLSGDLLQCGITCQPCEISSNTKLATPFLVVSNMMSRIESDIANSVQAIPTEEYCHMVLLALHVKEEKALGVTSTRDKLSDNSQFRNIGSIIDIAFTIEKGTYKCTMNTNYPDNIISECMRLHQDTDGKQSSSSTICYN